MKQIFDLLQNILGFIFPRPKIILPVNNGRVTSFYGERWLKGGKSFHDGIDFAAGGDFGQSAADRTVYAIADGVVVHDQDDYRHDLRFKDHYHSAGNMIIIKHVINGQEYLVRYLHLGTNKVSVGDQVTCGQAVGFYGNYGYSFGPHLHVDFYLPDWSEKIDPTNLLPLEAQK